MSEQDDGRYSARRVGTTGHEVLRDGLVVAWAIDEVWAVTVVAALNRADTQDN